MGRGRQKAKHTKVARELKYFSPDTNYNALERELTHPVTGASVDPKLEADLEKWPEFSAPVDPYADDYDTEDEFEAGQNKTA
ncbi:MAG TPA: DUF3073 domain-containing protein [Lacisediminihabitans sp.]|uniref:DUF3073 domain-containing protein n=1 Tax=Lacisediminihabitans sp. TaxID=2787631 RepID=UPI002ED9C83C